MRKFYAVVGNPPYQGENNSNGRKPPIYNDFMDAAYQVGQIVELVTPGRFLFNAGQTPTRWNEKMLADKHLKVLAYESDASKVFAGTDIKGGIAITLRDEGRDYGALGVFTVYHELNSIIKKVNQIEGDGLRLDSLIASQRCYKFSDVFYREQADDPVVKEALEKGVRIKIVSSLMQKLPRVFLDKEVPTDDEVLFFGRIDNRRQARCLARRYLQQNEYLDAYKLLIPEANNSGVYGETLADPLVSKPGEGTSDTFLNVGPFNTLQEVEHLKKYYKTKFFRSLLGAKKVTQHSPSQVWRTIPLQDFTSSSDIDWSKSIAEIDQQLYRKYGLDADEIEFIESHVKEMG